jgi:hypothetical protein
VPASCVPRPPAQGAFSVAALDALSGGGGPSPVAAPGPSGGGGSARGLPLAEELAAALIAERRATPPPAAAATPGRAAAAGVDAAGSPVQPPGLVRQASAVLWGSLGAAAAAGGSFSPPRELERAASTGAALGRASSGGLSRVGSISAKKASPNRVCCNALLAAYARAAPAQWQRALALLAGMWACGGEVTPDIVR